MIVTSVQIKTVKTQKHLYCPVFTAKRDIRKDVSFCFTRLILPFPRETTR